MGARPLCRTIQEDQIRCHYRFHLENPNEKDLRAVMTNKGTIQIKAQNAKRKIKHVSGGIRLVVPSFISNP